MTSFVHSDASYYVGFNIESVSYCCVITIFCWSDDIMVEYDMIWYDSRLYMIWYDNTYRIFKNWLLAPYSPAQKLKNNEKEQKIQMD